MSINLGDTEHKSNTKSEIGRRWNDRCCWDRDTDWFKATGWFVWGSNSYPTYFCNQLRISNASWAPAHPSPPFSPPQAKPNLVFIDIWSIFRKCQKAPIVSVNNSDHLGRGGGRRVLVREFPIPLPLSSLPENLGSISLSHLHFICPFPCDWQTHSP